MATKRTPRTGETLPADKAVAPSNTIKLKAIKLICPTCAFEYCPNAYQYAIPGGTPIGATVDKKQPCDYCKTRSQTVGCTDPANYGGIHPAFEK